MKNVNAWALLLVATALVGCGTAPQDGSDKVTYYYSGSKAPRSAVVVSRVVVPPPQENGPANVARIVYFDFDKSIVKPEYRSVVEAHGDYLRRNAQRKVTIEGHTDERGGREYNLALGQRRAESVRRSLVLLGAKDEQVEAISFGKEKPASTELSEKGYQLNRRAEFSYR